MTAEKRWQRDRRCDRQGSKLYQRRRDIERLKERLKDERELEKEGKL